MHDLHEADKIIKKIIEEAEKNNLSKITKVEIELGSIIEHGDEILPKNLQYNIKMLARDTIAEQADIRIKKIKGPLWRLVSIEGE